MKFIIRVDAMTRVTQSLTNTSAVYFVNIFDSFCVLLPIRVMCVMTLS